MDRFNCKNACSRLDGLLSGLIQALQQICLLNLEAPKNEQNPSYEEFLRTLMKGVELVKECEKTSDFTTFHNLRCTSRIQQLEKEIGGFVQCQMPPHILLDLKNLITELNNFHHLYEVGSVDESEMTERMCKYVAKVSNDPHENIMMLQQIGVEDLFDGAVDEAPCSYKLSIKSDFVRGLEKSISNLKRILLQREVSVVGVQGMGGLGKTTLVLALFNDQEIKEADPTRSEMHLEVVKSEVACLYVEKCILHNLRPVFRIQIGIFQSNIIFITVSQFPNLKGILETMWEKIVRRKKPEFQNVEDAHRQLQQQLLRQARPTLVVLDDVWSRVDLEKVLFEGEGYKTLVTTRDCSTIPKTPSTQLYQLPLLDDTDALSLFCFWAFGQRSIPSTAAETLVKQVQAECKGLPLALKVIGSSLHGQPLPAWERAKNKLLNGEPVSDYHKEGLLRVLETSIDVLDEETRVCFLDLGSFPEDRKICAESLLDIWVYVRKMDWQDAFVILLELASRNLLNLTSNLRPAINYGSASELYFSQHNVMRHLAIYLASRDSIVHRKRLLMPSQEHSLPRKCKLPEDQAFDAQIVSISTGAMEETQWCNMNFSEAEALILHFSASEYFLPLFLSSMRKLKVLIVLNYGSKRAIVNGLPALSSLTQLKTIHLERLIVAPLQEHSQALLNLEKLSLSLCEGLGNMSRFNSAQSSLELPLILDFNLDHCCDLEEFPAGICDMTSLQKWSITNCHLVEKLPDDLGKLINLRMLRLLACLGLKELPASIGKLGKLEYLDISLCECLEELPEEIGQLKKLKELDMRECSHLRKLPESVGGLKSLKHVLCDEQIGQQWMQVKSSALMELRVEVVEAHFSLDWLDG